MAELDRARIAADWGALGFSCDLWTDPPGMVHRQNGHGSLPCDWRVWRTQRWRGLLQNCVSG
jgi:hypothetical protein